MKPFFKIKKQIPGLGLVISGGVSAEISMSHKRKHLRRKKREEKKIFRKSARRKMIKAATPHGASSFHCITSGKSAADIPRVRCDQFYRSGNMVFIEPLKRRTLFLKRNDIDGFYDVLDAPC